MAFVWNRLVNALAVVCVMFTTCAHATSIQEIKARGKLIVATDVTIPPLNFLNEKNEPDGLDVELGKQIARDLGVQYEQVRVNNASRIPFLLTNKADIVISSFTITPERAQSVIFTSPYVVSRATVMAPAATRVVSSSDLAKLKIGVGRGTTDETDLVAIAPPGTQIVRFDDGAATIAALASGQVDAIAATETVIAGLQERFPDRKYETKIVLRNAYAGIGLRKEATELHQWLNTWVFFNKQNNFIPNLYKKWYKTETVPDLPNF
jgi:polar amino acid transport system substrate-binding protein